MEARKRGRPLGSGRPDAERRRRKDYRFSPETLRQLEQGQQLASTTETAFIEAAIGHYVGVLAEAAKRPLPASGPLPAPVTNKPEDTRTERPPARQPVKRKSPVSPPAPTPTAPSSLQQPLYQIFVKHEPGPHPSLPEGLTYDDLPKNIQPEQCPIHLVFARPCAIVIARQRVELLKQTPRLTAIWVLDRSGKALPRDSWRKDQDRWVRND